MSFGYVPILMQREGSKVLSEKVHSVKFSLSKLSLQFVSLFLLYSNTFQEQLVVTIRYVPLSETKRHHKQGVTLDEWVAKRGYLVNKKWKKMIRMLPLRPVEAGTTVIPTEGEERVLIPHLAGNVTSIFRMQVSGWLDDFPSAVLRRFPLSIIEGFRQKPCSKQI